MASCGRWCSAGWLRRPAPTRTLARSCSGRRVISSNGSACPAWKPCPSSRRSCRTMSMMPRIPAMPPRNRDRRAASGRGDKAGEHSGPDSERDTLTDVPGGVRLQKVLAAAGVGSRRHCEEMIGEGRVEVDGEIVRRFGARVDPQRQIIRVDGRRIPAREDLVYLALNKPVGVLTTMSDGRGRPTIADFLGDRGERLFHVGRLDYDTEGLVLLMNDGELAHRLAHPSFGVLKTYLAFVAGPLPRDRARHFPYATLFRARRCRAEALRLLERPG